MDLCRMSIDLMKTCVRFGRDLMAARKEKRVSREKAERISL